MYVLSETGCTLKKQFRFYNHSMPMSKAQPITEKVISQIKEQNVSFDDFGDEILYWLRKQASVQRWLYLFLNSIWAFEKPYTKREVARWNSMMPLVVEKLHKRSWKDWWYVWSIAHYWELNWDLMSDPEITFIVNHEEKRIYPESYTNHYMNKYHIVRKIEVVKWKKRELYNQKATISILKFMKQWFTNLTKQNYDKISHR